MEITGCAGRPRPPRPPQPLTIIHGEDDFVFEVEQARELKRRAGDGCRLKTFPDFGHAEMGYGPRLVEYLRRSLGGLRPGPGVTVSLTISLPAQASG